MSAVVCYVALSYDPPSEGHLRATKVRDCRNAEEAAAQAKLFGEAHAGAIAFSRALDLTAGKCAGAQLICKIGDVPQLSHLLGRAA